MKVYIINTGSCNGCDIELIAAALDKITDDPKEADILVITGGVNRKMRKKLLNICEQFEGKIVAVGSCAISGGVFKDSYSTNQGIDDIVPVDFYIPGCPPSPKIISSFLEGRDCENIENFRGIPKIDKFKCTGCGACSLGCPSSAIKIKDVDYIRQIIINYGDCIYCGECEYNCHDNAINLSNKPCNASLEKDNLINITQIKLSPCRLCGSYFIPTRQLDQLFEKIDDEEIRYYLGICHKCRSNIDRIKRAKEILSE